MADDVLPPADLKGPSEENSEKIVPVLQGYLAEAKQNRNGGLNPRDLKWEENLHLYWNRHDHGRKAAWQAREDVPEVPAFVDRFAAALKEALVSSPEGFYTITDPADQYEGLTEPIKNLTDIWLSMAGRNQTGTCLGFPAVFEEQCKMGALMACSAVVKWDPSYKQGRVAIETVDPRFVWLDHTYRNLYRVRRTELDKHDLRKMATSKDRKGKSIFNLEAVNAMVSHIEGEDTRRREEATGHGHQNTSTRQPVILDEYIATVVGSDGRVLAENAMMVVGNDKFLVRGPEANPYWHGKDWMVYAPLVTAPLSVYGRTYMEDFGATSKTFNNLTNLILDAVQMSTMKAFAVVPSMLMNPEQINEGITPNKLFALEEGVRPEDFLHAIDLGHMPPESVQVWQGIKASLREAADINEIGLGQFAPKGRTSATEVSQTQESSSALIRSIASTIETRFLNPVLDLVWQTGLQHCNPNDPALAMAAGQEMWRAIMTRRREIASRPITFQARGISTLIQKNKMLKSVLQLTQYLAQSKELLASFLQSTDIDKFVKLLFELSDIDMSKFAISEQQRMVNQTTQGIAQAGAQAQAATANQQTSPGMQQEMAQAAQMMGVGR